MKTDLTPKQLADAIGASESSLRRWVDNGQIRMSRTAGGHRRIPIDEAIRFVRESGATLLRPDLLGLDATLHPFPVNDESETSQLFHALLAGERKIAKGLVVSWYLEGRSLPELFDGPVRGAMSRIGELWEHGEQGILVEHRGTQVCLDLLRELRVLLPSPPAEAPAALGGAPAGDPYLIPSTMAALVVAEAGYRDINYGGNTPLALLRDAVAEHRAKLVWVSLSSPVEREAVRAELENIAARVAEYGTIVAVGGRYANEVFPESAGNARLVHTMAELSALARQSM